jgi:tetratricopeptide (TPR) repeat protein
MTLEWKWEEAGRGFQRTIELDPGYVWGRFLYGWFLATTGSLEESRRQLERAQKLAPTAVAPSDIDLGLVLEWMGDSEAAVAAWSGALEVDPSHFSSLRNYGRHLCLSGKHEEGLRLVRRLREDYPDTPSGVADIAYCDALSGDAEGARRGLRELQAWSEREYVDPVNMAAVHTGLGDHDAAFAALERAYEQRAFLISHIPRDRRLVPLRGDPRFADLLRGVGLDGEV